MTSHQFHEVINVRDQQVWSLWQDARRAAAARMDDPNPAAQDVLAEISEAYVEGTG